MIIQKNEKLLTFDLPSGAIIYNTFTKKSHRLGIAEYSVFKAIDGKCTIDELASITGYDTPSMYALLKLFDTYGFLASSEMKTDKQTSKKHTLVYKASFLDAFSKSAYKNIFDLLVLSAFPLLIAAIVFMQGKIDVDMMIDSANIVHVLVMDLILAVSIGLHEIFHAIAAKSNGAFCAEIGYTFDFLTPMAYTTLCGIDEIKSKLRRIEVYFAGISANALIATISLLLMNMSSLNGSLFMFLVFACNLCLIIVNCITLFKSDGYYIFCNIFNTMTLKEDMIAMLKGKIHITPARVLYFILSYLLEPAAIIVLLITAINKIGGNM